MNHHGMDNTSLPSRRLPRLAKNWASRYLLRKAAAKSDHNTLAILHSLYHFTPIGIYFYNLEDQDRLIFKGANPAADRIIGRHHSGFIGRTIEEVFPSLGSTEVPATYKAIARQELSSQSFDIYYQEQDIDAWFTVTAFHAGGRTVAVNFFDITDRKQNELNVKRLLAEKDLLLRENHHRVKNNLSVVKSLLSLQTDEAAPEVADRLQVAAGRVESMMQLYDKLHRRDYDGQLELQGYLPSLAAEILEVFNTGRTVRLMHDIGDISLSTKQVSPLGIIINELIANSMKHAFQPGEPAEITIRATEADGVVELRYCDSGCPKGARPGQTGSAAAKGGGMGLQVVQALVDQLDGHLDISHSPGMCFSIRFPRRDDQAD